MKNSRTHVALGFDPKVHGSICRYESKVIEDSSEVWIVGSSLTMTRIVVRLIRKSEMHYITIHDHILLTLKAHFSGFFGGLFAT